MANIKDKIDTRLLGLVGAVLLIISEFLPWFSGFNLIEVYMITTAVALEESFLYLFPVISGIISLTGSILIYYNEEYNINAVIIDFIGIAFMMIFFFEIIPGQILFSEFSGFGFYFCVTGFILMLFEIINLLI